MAETSRTTADRPVDGRTPPETTEEPVVRPVAMPPHNTHVVRRARLFAEGHDLVLRDARLRERRFPVGEDGIRRAVHFPPGDLWETVRRSPGDRWGVLVFQGADGSELVRVPLAAWLPEAELAGMLELSPAQCLRRTGLEALVTHLGIPLEASAAPWDRAARDGERRGRPVARAEHRGLPRWHSWVRALGMLGWIVALVAVLAGGPSWARTVAAGALFLVPGADVVVRVTGWWRRRWSADFVGAVSVEPSPAAEEVVTERFLRTAAVRVLPEDIVLTNTVGEERRLARRGDHGVTQLSRLIAPESGRPIAVEFRGGEGEARALLPWSHWFAGPQGDDRWKDLVRALGVPVSDERHGWTEGAKHWSEGHILAEDARCMAPMGGAEARRRAGWYGTVVGRNEPLALVLLSAVLLPGAFRGTGAAVAAGILSGLTVGVVLVPQLCRALFSRVWFDRATGEGRGYG
ncbi:hypothetical protein GCM10019016_034100 [Streptomyces prasinosporus]|uniref:Uncharacterized protein n=1 Tax=Streptomyces prasinosporus TaxID=68256 RepID=A0ABP6TP34_9ACTN|nr:hypothetical protein GCM10010332_34050 [Streptomyces albogriseolus]